MALDESLGGKISNHFSATFPQESAVINDEITAYDVVKSCFKQITLFRKTEKDWGIAATHLMDSFEAVTSQKISISSSTLKSYYYAIKATSSSKKRKKSKSKPSAIKSPPVVEVATVDDLPPEVDSASPEETVAEIPKDTVVTAGKKRKKAADAHGGFQVPRRPGFTPPVHISGL
ncbi:hypothetical protein [Nodosilinea sp. E11]|uniref:hypothetical protein n=1 Tax=Nodosilinea sp. E11 TaxID=3037479 RepID=UPI002934DAF4|nr:hypothetical protein [Nodosilinea sp. E11]WOD36955.1 hypothetical protein RRF56_00340 [Nodosilinea sp. E11]